MTPASTPTVFYVDDMPENVQLMQALFELRPALRLVVAHDGLEALQALASLRPALLLLDLNLPDCHGTALLQQLRRQPGLAGVPAVAVTADADFDPRSTGFCEVWRKPLHVARVLERLDALLRPQGGQPGGPQTGEPPRAARVAAPAGLVDAPC